MPLVGVHLKELRTRRKLTIRELASRAGISHATVSLIERDKTSPSVDTLAAMLDALGVTLLGFFEGIRQPLPYSPFYSDDALVEIGVVDSISYRMLGMHHPNRRILMLRETYQVGAGTDVSCSHAAQETGFVLRGEVEVTVGAESRVLRTGDGYYFDSEMPHRFQNVGDTEVEIVSAGTPPTY